MKINLYKTCLGKIIATPLTDFKKLPAIFLDNFYALDHSGISEDEVLFQFNSSIEDTRKIRCASSLMTTSKNHPGDGAKHFDASFFEYLLITMHLSGKVKMYR